VIQPGEFNIMVGSSSVKGLTKTLIVE
jgi:hypothetical protein